MNNGVTLKRAECGMRPLSNSGGELVLVFLRPQDLVDLLAEPAAELADKIRATPEGKAIADALGQTKTLRPKLAEFDTQLAELSRRRNELDSATAASLDEIKETEAEFSAVQNRRNEVAADFQRVCGIIERGANALVPQFSHDELAQRVRLKAELRQRAEAAMDKIERVAGDALRELMSVLAAESELHRRDLPASMGGSPPLSPGDIGHLIAAA